MDPPRIPAVRRRARRRFFVDAGRCRAAPAAECRHRHAYPRHERSGRLSQRQCGWHGDDFLRQGRSWPGLAHRHSTNGGRRARHRHHACHDDRGRYCVDARPGPDGGQLGDHARGRADSPGRGHRTAGAHRPRRGACRPAGRGLRRGERRDPAEIRRYRDRLRRSRRRQAASRSRSMRKRRCAIPRRTPSSASRCRVRMFRAR